MRLQLRARRGVALVTAVLGIVAGVAGVTIAKRHVPGPQGVRGRNSNNDRLREILGWEPQISLEEGLARTYRWIEAQVAASLGVEVSDAVA